MFRLPTICWGCTHLFDIRTLLDNDFTPVCDAFPTGIPKEILGGQLDHTIEFPGDHGILFEEEEGLADAVDRYYQWRNSDVARSWYGDPA